MIKKIKLINFFIIIILTILFIIEQSYGFELSSLEGGTPLGQGQTSLEKFFGNIINIIGIIASVISVIVLVVLGIKYMIGSVEERAEYKRTLIPYLIGAIFVFSGSTITMIIYNIAKSI